MPPRIGCFAFNALIQATTGTTTHPTSLADQDQYAGNPNVAH